MPDKEGQHKGNSVFTSFLFPQFCDKHIFILMFRSFMVLKSTTCILVIRIKGVVSDQILFMVWWVFEKDMFHVLHTHAEQQQKTVNGAANLEKFLAKYIASMA